MGVDLSKEEAALLLCGDCDTCILMKPVIAPEYGSEELEEVMRCHYCDFEDSAKAKLKAYIKQPNNMSNLNVSGLDPKNLEEHIQEYQKRVAGKLIYPDISDTEEDTLP